MMLMVIMLVMTLISIGGVERFMAERKKRIAAERKIARLGAKNDDELAVIIDATDTPMAIRVRRLLREDDKKEEVSKNPPKRKLKAKPRPRALPAPAPGPVPGFFVSTQQVRVLGGNGGSGTLAAGAGGAATIVGGRRKMTLADYQAFLRELSAQVFDDGKLAIIDQWIREGFGFTTTERSGVLGFFVFDEGRNQARRLMGAALI